MEKRKRRAEGKEEYDQFPDLAGGDNPVFFAELWHGGLVYYLADLADRSMCADDRKPDDGWTEVVEEADAI